MNTPKVSSNASRRGSCARFALAAAIAGMVPAFHAGAADILKTGVAGNLETAGSWTGGIAPGLGDMATWNSTSILTAAGNILGANVSWQGLKVTNVTGALSIGNTAANTLVMTLGAGGIDMTAATQNVTITNAMTLGGSQSWTVAGGRTLTLGAAVNSGRSVNSTLGDTLTLAQSGAGTATFNFNPATAGTGFNDGSSFNAFAGNWSIGANVRVLNYRNGATAWGTGTIGLNGGTIAQNQGAWTWTNNITLGTGTTSSIEDANTSGTTRALKLQGVISGDGNLTFIDPNNRMDVNNGFILTGANTMSGTVTVGANGDLRVGGVAGNDTTLGAGTGGTLGTASVSLSAATSTLTFSRNNTWTVANAISGSGALRIGSTGIAGTITQDVTLTGANSYGGPTTIANGTARIGAGGTSGSLGSGAVTNNGVLSFNRSDAVIVANTISGTGSLAQDGAGATTLSGPLSYSGATSVNAGRLNVNTTLTSSAITVGGGTLAGNGTFGTVTVNVGGTIEAGNVNVGIMSFGTLTFGAGATIAKATAGAGGAVLDITASNGLVLNGTTTLNVGGVNLTVGIDYPLVDYVGIIGGSGFAGFTLGTVPARVVGNLVNNVANTSVDFHVSAFDKPKWTGATNGRWDTSTVNWKEITSATSTAYIQGDDVTFDGSATGTTSVVLNATVSPSAVTVDSSTLAYNLSGTGKISGTTSLTKNGTTTLTIGNSGGNDYAGATTINGGTLKFGVANALPAAGSVSVENGATLDLGGFAGQVGAITGWGGVTNSGGAAATLTVANGANITFDGVIANGAGTIALVKSGAGALTLTNANTFTGGTTISAGKFVLGDGGASGSIAGAITDNGTLEINRSDTFTLASNVSGTGALSQAGSGTTVLTGTNSYGATAITWGILQVGNGGTSGSLGTGAVSIGGGAMLIHNRSDAASVSGVISGAGSFQKDGAGALTVSGNNASFTGGTTILNGTLNYGNSNALGAGVGGFAAAFTLRNGTVDFNGQTNYSGNLPNGVLLVSGQTITLGGSAGGAMTIQDASGLGFGSYFAASAGTSFLYDATNDPGTATIAAKFLSTGQSGVVTRTITVGDSAAVAVEMDFTGQLSASGFQDGKGTTIIKNGAGTLRISAANFFPGLRVSAGALIVNHAQALGASRTGVEAGSAHLLTVDGGTVDLNGFSPAIGGLSDGGVATGVVKNNGAGASTLTTGAGGGNNVFSGTLTNGVSALALTKAGNGTLTLSGANTYTGATSVSVGRLNLTGSLTSAVTVASGATIAGTGSTTGLLTVNGNLALAGGATTTSMISNGATFGASMLNFDTVPVATTVYDVVTYAGGALNTPANLEAAAHGTFADTGTKYTFTAAGPAPRTWNTTTGTWGSGTPLNFAEGDLKYFDGDTVIFNEPASASVITLSGRLTPASVSFNNTTNLYTLTGTAGTSDITGASSLAKTNGGTLAISTQQTYTGGTTVSGGVLDLTGGGGASGTIRGTATVNIGATLRLSTGDATGYNTNATRLSVINLVGGTLNVNTISNQTLGSAVVNMTGASITGIAGSNIDLFANGSAINTLASATTSTISLPTMNLRQNDTVFDIADGAAAVDLAVSASLGNGSVGNHNLIKNGAGTMQLTANNTFTGNIAINSGILDVATNGLYRNIGGTAVFTNVPVITINAGGTLKLKTFTYNGDGGTGGLSDYAGRRVLNGGAIEVMGATHLSANNFTVNAAGGTFRYNPAVTSDTLTLAGNGNTDIPIAGTLNFQTVGNITVNEVIEGAGGITKTGGQTLNLTQVNTFTGGITISAGIVNVNANSALGAIGAGVAIDSNATLQAGGAVSTGARTVTLGSGGGVIDTNGNAVNLNAGSTVTGTTLTKVGNGTLTLAGTQTYLTLTTSAGATNIASALGTGTSTVNANAATNFSFSQTLAALNIGAGAVVTFGAVPPPFVANSVGEFTQAVPEPGSAALLLGGIVTLLGRRRSRKSGGPGVRP